MNTVNREAVKQLPGMWIDTFRSRLCSDRYGLPDIDLHFGSETVIRNYTEEQLNKLILLGVINTK